MSKIQLQRENTNGSEVNHSTNGSSKLSDEQKSKNHVRQSFLEWLRSGNGIYHISGKAGSGKSTLMKFLCQNPRLTNELEQWAGNRKLVYASFFFWASGDRLQRSLEGLYRSLLFEVLSQCPGLIKSVFPEQWAKMKSNPVEWVGMPLLFSELRQAMQTITTKCSFAHHRFSSSSMDLTNTKGIAPITSRWLEVSRNGRFRPTWKCV